MIQFDIRAHKEAMESLKSMERTMEQECDNQLAAIDRTIGVWEGAAARQFRADYSSMLRLGEYAELQGQIRDMYRIMEEAFGEMKRLKNSCENFYSTLAGKTSVPWSLGAYGSPSSLLMAEPDVIRRLCIEFDNLCEANRSACSALESVIDQCGGIVNLDAERNELRRIREQTDRIERLRDAMDSYSRRLADLDKDLTIQYSKWIDEDVLKQLAAPQKIEAALAGDETAIAAFEQLIAKGTFTQETLEYLAREYVKISQNKTTDWEEVALYLANEALKRGRAFTDEEIELIRWRNAQYSLGYISVYGSEQKKLLKVENLLGQKGLTRTEAEFLYTWLEEYINQGDHEKIKEITTQLLEASYEVRETANGTQTYYTVKANEEMLQGLKNLAIEYGAIDLYNYVYTLGNMQIQSLPTDNKSQCGYYLLSEMGADGNIRLVLCMETDIEGDNTEVCVKKDGDNLKLILEQCKDLSALSDEQQMELYESMGQYDIIERLLNADKKQVYEYKQMMTNGYKRLEFAKTQEIIRTNGMEEWLTYLFADAPYAEGAELDEWNEKRIIAHKKQTEWIAQDIDIKPIEEYYYNQCGQNLLLKIQQEAEEDPVGSSCKSVVLNMIAGVSGTVYQLTSYLSGAPIDATSGMYMPLQMSQMVRQTVGNNIYEGLGGGILGTAGNMAYQGIMGVGDYGLATMTGLGVVLMAMEGYTQAGQEAAERGLSASDIQAEAVAGAIAEITIERILSGVGKSGSTIASHAFQWVKAGVTEAGTSAALWSLDKHIAEDLSYDELLLQSYIAEGEGEEEARIHVVQDRLKQAAINFGTGVVMASVVDVAKMVTAGNQKTHVEVENRDRNDNEGGIKSNGIKTWDDISEMLMKEGLDEKKIREIVSIPKGSRPDPTTYLSKEYIDTHLSHFQDGVTKIKSKAPVDTEGVGLGTFVMPKSVADDVIAQASGDVLKLEELLGLNPGDLGTNPVRVDIPNPQNIRIPSGNEAGAWPGYWTPGGYTKPGGVMEAVIDPVPKTEYIVTEDILGK